jgi:hypothetical protein
MSTARRASLTSAIKGMPQATPNNLHWIAQEIANTKLFGNTMSEILKWMTPAMMVPKMIAQIKQNDPAKRG